MRRRVFLLLIVLGLAAAAEAQPASPARIGSVTPTRFGIGDELTFRVTNLAALCPDRDEDAELRLFLDGYPLPGVVPEMLAPDRVRFDLEPGWTHAEAATESNVWAKLVSGSLFGPQTREVRASLGYESCPGGAWARTPDVGLTLVVLPTFWKWVWIASMLVIVGLTVWLARRTPLLREGGAEGPYSLGRTQIAFWTVLALGAFLLILISTGYAANLNADVLVLLGISAATGLGGAVIDAGKQGQMERKAALRNTQAELSAAAAVSAAGAAPDPAILEQQRQVATELAQLKPLVRQPKRSFFADLLQDGTGYSVYRLQFVLWTLVLGGYFIYAVISRLTMPTFSDQLLTLMGISSGTYVTLKTQENQV